jgi:hypothetical protein
MSASNYPPGVSDNTIGAPWNEPVVPDEEFEVTCSQSLSKTVTVTTNNYIPGASGVDYERDDEGGTYASPWHDDPDTSDTNWAEEFSCSHYTPLQIISKCGELCKYLLDRNMTSYGINSLKRLLEECSDWTEDETEYIEN